MREYFIGVTAVVILVAVCELIAYRVRADGGRKFAFAVIILYTVLIPLRSVGEFTIDGMLDGSLDPSEYSEDYIEVAEAAFCDGVRELICEEFSLSGECVRVLVDGFDFNSMKAKRIRVFLSGKAALADYKGIERYIEEKGLGECDAEIEIG